MRLIASPARTVLVAAAAALLVSGGCGGDGSKPSVASLSGKSSAVKATKSTHEPSKQETEDAFRKFAQCMREHGIDMADPTSGQGGFNVTVGNGTAPQDKGKLDVAQKACQHFIDSVVQGRARDMDPAQAAKARDRALKFAQCMREHGIDMPDPEFASSGRVTQKVSGNPNDPKFQQAQNACAKDMPGGGKGPKTQVGPGGGGNGGFGLQTGGQ